MRCTKNRHGKMETNANQDGKMTTQRAETIKAFIRSVEGAFENAINKEIAGSGISARMFVDKKEAKRLGKELVEEVKKDVAGIDRIKELIRNGADLNAKNQIDMSALMYASWYDQKEIVKILIDNGADVNLGNKFDNTALQFASRMGHIETVEILLTKGVNVKKYDQGAKSLIEASLLNHREITEIMIRSHVNLDKMDRTGMTALMRASEGGHKEIVEILMCAGADVNLKSGLDNNRKELAKIFPSTRTRVNQSNDGGKTAADYAKNEEIKKMLEDAAKCK